jgi:Ca2+-binding RTX toxin-like protein
MEWSVRFNVAAIGAAILAAGCGGGDVEEPIASVGLPLTTAFYFAGNLLVGGDAADNTIVVGADPATGDVFVTSDGLNVGVGGGIIPNLANVMNVVVNGGAGNDDIRIDGSLNIGESPTLAFAATLTLTGDEGDDVLTVESGGFNGTINADGAIEGTILGNANMYGGDGNDTFKSGFGNDVIRGGPGDDTLIHDNFSNDVWDGETGIDTIEVVGDDGVGNNVNLFAASGGDALIQRANLVQFSIIEVSATERVRLVLDSSTAGDDQVTVNNLTGAIDLDEIEIFCGGGNDVVNAENNLAPTPIVAHGGGGNDVILLGNGDDRVTGGRGDDLIFAGGGRNRVSGGRGNDEIHGGPGRDLIDGGPGNDLCDPGAGTNSVQRCEL